MQAIHHLAFLVLIALCSSHRVLSLNTNTDLNEVGLPVGPQQIYIYEQYFQTNIMSIKNKVEMWQINDTLHGNATNLTMNYGSCNPILFQLGDFSRDGPNLLFGICPDTWLTTAVSITFIVAYVIVLIISGFGLYLKRNSPHIKARKAMYMLMTILSNSGFIILTCLRFIIGRRIYPCSIYILSFFIIPPGILLPSVFRLWRLVFMHKLNALKTNDISKSGNKEDSKEKSIIEPTLKKNMDSPRFEQSELYNTNTEIDVSDDNNSYWIENELELKMSAKHKKIYNFLLSQKFVIVTFIISFIVHIILFVIFGGIEEGVYNQDTSKQRIFMGEGGFFVSTRGCVISNAITIIVAVEALFYIVVELVLLVMCFIIPRDTWFIKRETLLLVLLQFITIIVFAVCGFLVQITKLTDFFVPFGFTLMSYSFAEVVICVLLPILYALLGSKKEQFEESELQQFLRNKKTYAILLDFARRSYCPESVLCYQDIERFKLTNKKNRKRAALHITKTYLKPNSPLELNFQKLDQTYDQISKQIETTPLLEPNFFDSIQWHCVEDMTDVFERLKTQSKETRKILQEWKGETDSRKITSMSIQHVELVQIEASTTTLPSSVSTVDQQELETETCKTTTTNNEINSEKPKEETPIDNLDYL